MAPSAPTDSMILNDTEPHSEKDIENHPTREKSATSVASGSLSSLDISARDADEAFAFIREHPDADSVRQEALDILADPQRLKTLLKKIDWTIVPCLVAVYFLQFLDKTTISYAAVMGLREDTHLVGQDYSNVAMMFYVGFIFAEFPTQYLAQHISRLGKYLGANVMLWGVVLACMSATSSYAGLMVTRTFLGIFEAPVAPILQGRRVSYFYVCNSLTQIFGGAVAYGASFSTSKFASWRIFMLTIGLMTILFGGLVFTFLPDSPVKAARFTPAEKLAALLRVKDNHSGTQNPHIKKAQILESLRDVRVWLVSLSVLLTSIPNGGLSNFSSILLTTFGYTSQQALILNLPSGAVGVVVVLFTGWLSDRLNDRSLVMLVCLIPTIIAAAMMYGLDPGGVPAAHTKGWLLFASYLSGTFGAAFMLLLAWNASNLAGHSKKVTVNALTLVAFCLGNILGTQTFRQSEAPGYRSGKVAIMACLSAQVVVCFVLRWCNDRLNRQNRRVLEGMSESEKGMERERLRYADETDRRNPFFVYTH